MTHADGDYEIGFELLDGSKLHVRSLRTRNLCANQVYENCVLAMKQPDFVECER